MIDRPGLCIALLAAAAVKLPAQILPAELKPEHAHRAVAGGGALVSHDPRWLGYSAATYQVSIRKSKVDGNVITPPRWYFHVAAGVGIAKPPSADRHFAGTGSAGVVRRNDHKVMTSAGAVVRGVTAVNAFGPGVRIELLDNLAFEAGWMRSESLSGGQAFLVVEYTEALSDLIRVTFNPRSR